MAFIWLANFLMGVCLQRRKTRAVWSCYVSWKYLLNLYLLNLYLLNLYLFCTGEIKICEWICRLWRKWNDNGDVRSQIWPGGVGPITVNILMNWIGPRHCESAATDSKARISNTVLYNVALNTYNCYNIISSFQEISELCNQYYVILFLLFDFG